MRKEQKTNIKNSIGRAIVAALSLALQIIWIVQLFTKLNQYSTGINMFTVLIALFLVVWIYGKNQNAAFKMMWIILLLAAPVLGVCMYVLIGHDKGTKKMRARFKKIDGELFSKLEQAPGVMETLEDRDYGIANQFRYIHDYGYYPVYQNADVEFYSEAAEAFEAQLCDLKRAENFIFLEYHAIEEAQSFSRMKEILAERAAHGVEVRILYDDAGSVGFIDPKFVKRMEEIGVTCRVFNPVMPFLNLFMNNRDHRKITVIDGKVAYTGGYNLADEYFNITHPYGKWKDTGIRLAGEAVKSFTIMFLEMWNAVEETDTEFEKYLPHINYRAKEQGFIQPFADMPLDEEYMGENVYMNMIKNAKHTLYVATPYLIISDEMNRELTLAAQRGVDVRMITPGIPDKKVIYKVTRSNYNALVDRGVRIYEYTPGFIHEKQVLADGELAAVGTINFDYRSLYHHFENGVLIYGYNVVKEIGKDFEETFDVSNEVTEHYRNQKNVAVRFAQGLMQILSPLL
ncbi:MAG: cardiolipin synthase [Lachnospiraceae bacterium]|nr:cardiolipin synthase [Lachnospiraceae bacterium]